MTLIEILVRTPAAKALGWTLVHSVWEGAVIALALAVGLCILRSSSARYAASCLALVSMLAGFGLTFVRLMPQRSQLAATEISAIPHVSQGPELAVNDSVRSRAAESLPWLAPFWIAGVLVFHMRALANWIIAQRLRRTGVCCASDFWQQRMNRLGARLHLSSPVMLLESCLADVPIVIGYLRPVILIPVGLLAGLPPGQVESILLHELAHIRRYDYFVNLLQTSVESLLFYHPAAWWISRMIRTERENCCDDLVVATSGDPHQYALALAALEQIRCSIREATLAATGGSLVTRIRRVLHQPEGPRAALKPVFSAGVLTIAAALVLAGWQTKPAGPGAQVFPAAAASKPPLKLLAQAQQASANLPPSSPYWKWLNEDAAYIITDKERAAFVRLETDPEREQFITQFWLRRDPTPGTSENEFKEEHYRRIAYANQRFATTSLVGWKTDRGRIYIIWGPPDEIESHPSGGAYERPPAEGGGVTSTLPFEQWLYRHLQGLGDNVIVEYVDKTGTGDFEMTMDPHGKETAPDTAQAGSPPRSRPHAIFVSKEPGLKATVEITPDRRMLVNIPIDFNAKQYSIIGTTRASDGRASPVGFRAVVSLCKNSPGALACLERPVFHPDPTALEKAALDPGSYTFNTTVKDVAGATEKTYIVQFDVN